MSPVTGKKQDIVETIPGYYLDYQLSDTLPVARNAQRKIAMQPDGTLFMVFKRGARLGIAISNDEGVHWKVVEDIFAKFVTPTFEYALRPAMTVDKGGMLHLVFQAYGPQSSSMSLL